MNKKQNYQIITERIDDVVLLLNVMKQIELPELINSYLPRHPNQRGLDWGWVGVIWLSYILSQGDHRKVTVRKWVNQRRYTIEKVCGIELMETDFTDERLTILLGKLSQESTWSQIEGETLLFNSSLPCGQSTRVNQPVGEASKNWTDCRTRNCPC